ncbi:hypothetical protein [Clostridium ihumii]|uniref:hypothetical protein n=1 Tax=Clostridium ihumii TaxID=1470356 RepID=UPI0006884543|nr:hypothetical protein [Clostridium ihumii]
MGKNMISLDKFAGEKLAARVNESLKEILENIKDPNTDFKKKRELSVKMKFVTDEDRSLSDVEIETKTKLAPRTSVKTKVVIDFDGNEVIASEYQKQVPGQIAMKVDPETGEVTTTAPQEEDNLTGLKVVK